MCSVACDVVWVVSVLQERREIFIEHMWLL